MYLYGCWDRTIELSAIKYFMCDSDGHRLKLPNHNKGCMSDSMCYVCVYECVLPATKEAMRVSISVSS